MTGEILKEKIRYLAREKNALILAHNYQNPEIQDIADYVGDSLELSRIAADNSAGIIVFCGVHFMAESASLLSPDKKVLLPEPSAGCPMADMAEPDSIRAEKAKYPGAKVVTYINSSAAVKAESDVICTSSNAIDIVNRVDGDEILFVPDRNLGSWVEKHTKKNVHLWKGFCPVHADITVEEVENVRKSHPDSILMVHPECDPSVVAIADEVLSTGGMVRFVEKTDAKSIIVGTEIGMIHKLKKTAPSIEFISASSNFICPNMKKTTLEKVYAALDEEKPIIKVDTDIADRARCALRRMLDLSK
ncbi:MAG TPA: quinolinate synthase NadA [Spirochaetota bacterium]|nr:quinolinate synthase NadA [Spirochaetota bacterium]